MIALVASGLLVLYLLTPGIIFRVVFSLYIPLKEFQRTKTQQLTFAALISLAPLLLAMKLIWVAEVGDLKIIFTGLYSAQWFTKHHQVFWEAATPTLNQLGYLLAVSYLLVIIEAIILGRLSTGYASLRRFGIYRWIARKLLFPRISEWYVLLTPFVRPGRIVMADILTSDDHLYRGEVSDHFVDIEGRLSGILLDQARRFDRRTYLRNKDAGQAKPIDYWRPIPGDRLYVAANKITSINISYELPPEEVPQEVIDLLKELNIEAHVTIQEPDTTSDEAAPPKE